MSVIVTTVGYSGNATLFTCQKTYWGRDRSETVSGERLCCDRRVTEDFGARAYDKCQWQYEINSSLQDRRALNLFPVSTVDINFWLHVTSQVMRDRCSHGTPPWLCSAAACLRLKIQLVLSARQRHRLTG